MHLSGRISTYYFQTLKYTILSSMMERHEELHWHGSTFPGPGKLFESLTMMTCVFTFESCLGRKQSSCSSGTNLSQDFHMLSSSQWADSEGCGTISVCYLPQRTTVTCSHTSQTFEGLAEVHLFTLSTLDSPRKSLRPQWTTSLNCGSGRWTAEFYRNAKPH